MREKGSSVPLDLEVCLFTLTGAPKQARLLSKTGKIAILKH